MGVKVNELGRIVLFDEGVHCAAGSNEWEMFLLFPARLRDVDNERGAVVL